MKKTTFTLFLLFLGCFSQAQIVELDYSKGNAEKKKVETTKPQVLQNGFLDFLSDGNIQASARLLKLNIGEPAGKFHLPLYVYTGASGKAFGDSKFNQTTISNLLNPIGGTVNISFNRCEEFEKKPQTATYTKFTLAYQLGGKLVNGTDSVKKENVNFFNGYGNLGFLFQTGAWEGENTDNVGIFYIQGRATASISSKANLQPVFGNDIESSYFLGYSVDAGIGIKDVINLKIGVYQYLNNWNVTMLKSPIVKFSMDYTLKK